MCVFAGSAVMKNQGVQHSRYNWYGWELADCIISQLLFPFEWLFSLAMSMYMITESERNRYLWISARFGIGVVLWGFLVLCIPLTLVGYVLWVILNFIATKQPFIYSSNKEPSHSKRCPMTFTFCSVNALLGPEFLAQFGNCSPVAWRINEIPMRLLEFQDRKLNTAMNLSTPVERGTIVQNKLPNIDIIIFQEVFERRRGRQLADRLKNKYSYCIYDVAMHSVSSNLCCLGSGLFLASKFPILEAYFHPFTYKPITYNTVYGRLVGIGVLVAKVGLGLMERHGQQVQAVGYVANLHTLAYEGTKPIISRQLREAHDFISGILKKKLPNEHLVFSVIGGDFNCDNMSPCNRLTQNLPLWEEYTDVGRKRAGEDYPWTVGSEMRPIRLNHPVLRDPTSLRDILLDDLKRRLFVIDADVEIQDFNLNTVLPRKNSRGEITAMAVGRRRRVDYLLFKGEVKPLNYWVSTVLSGLTDHIPVALMVTR